MIIEVRIIIVVLLSIFCGFFFGLWQNSAAAGWFMGIFACLTAAPGWVKE
jgi:ABC-type multidrug transport system permease subunit